MVGPYFCCKRVGEEKTHTNPLLSGIHMAMGIKYERMGINQSYFGFYGMNGT